jgi:S1-C subfamily serine protease
MTLWLLSLWLAAVRPAQIAPTSAALHRAWTAAAPTLVEVHGPHRTGPGFLVASSGEVLTTVDFVGLDAAEVVVDGKAYPAKVRVAKARLKLAVLSITREEPFRALAAELSPPLPGDWVIGVTRGRKGVFSPHLGQVLFAATDREPFVRTDLAASPGTPLLDARGRLLGLVVDSKGAGARAVPLPVVKSELAESKP